MTTYDEWVIPIGFSLNAGVELGTCEWAMSGQVYQSLNVQN
ncbi:MAG: hypothetical protein AB1861_22750 [Cyanobacteriota bacterium]